MVCLSCTATGERVCLAAEGFGNRHCFLENIADKNIPPDLSQCVFVIEQALSVRALQELVTAAGSETVTYHFFITREHRTTIYIYIYIYIIENIVTTFTKYLDFNNFNNYSIPPR
ncbi:ryanodine receptor-like, partial [Apis florea]|uniref:ryanodine receptor-like n=1 Tax=Apis florea TaxID=7463 RepID=UPI0006297CBF